MNELALFTGAGGGLLASKLLGWKTKCAVEINPHCQNVLLQRQKDGMLDIFPIWDDVETFDGKPWRNKIDVITGGFPCQDISAAGKREGLAGRSSRLVFEMLRITEEVRPKFVFAENSQYLRTRGLNRILQEFNRLGYDARWCVLGARHIGANHQRNRMWIVAYLNMPRERNVTVDAKVAGAPSADGVVKESAYPNSLGQKRRLSVTKSEEHARAGDESFNCNGIRDTSNTDSKALRLQPRRCSGPEGEEAPFTGKTDWWSVPRFAGVDDGLANKLERIRATGNGQVPSVAVLAWNLLTQGLL